MVEGIIAPYLHEQVLDFYMNWAFGYSDNHEYLLRSDRSEEAGIYDGTC